MGGPDCWEAQDLVLPSVPSIGMDEVQEAGRSQSLPQLQCEHTFFRVMDTAKAFSQLTTVNNKQSAMVNVDFLAQTFHAPDLLTTSAWPPPSLVVLPLDAVISDPRLQLIGCCK